MLMMDVIMTRKVLNHQSANERNLRQLWLHWKHAFWLVVIVTKMASGHGLKQKKPPGGSPLQQSYGPLVAVQHRSGSSNEFSQFAEGCELPKFPLPGIPVYVAE
jgi:hypothetical protein